MDGKYWVARGYNRLPKKGGKFNELHGGASLEEHLVPVVVFTADKQSPKIEETARAKPQIVDNMDFDI
jgi:hypothetical protein